MAAACLALAGCGSNNGTGVATVPPDQTQLGGTPIPSATALPATAPGAATAPGTATTGAIDVVSQYFSALQTSDCTTAFSLIAEPLRTRVGSATALCAGSTTGAAPTVGAATGDPASGQVSVSVSLIGSDGSARSENVIVINRQGSWKISDIVTSAPNGGTGGQINMDSLTAAIQQQYAAQSGGATLTLTCSRSGSFPASPGDSFKCTFSDTHGRTGSLTVNITSANGDYTWAIG